jgi:phosphoribosylformimino-5-aminoimidazole carboxamide ribonucleotide (ProFAR) isomerase
MIVPCIDLMGGKVVQLVQGREKALEGDSPLAMLEKFKAFPEIQVIDLDAAIGNGANDDLVQLLAANARTRIGGGIRTATRAQTLADQGAYRIIVGTAAFTPTGANTEFLQSLVDTVGRDKLVIALDSKDGKIVIKGWRAAMDFTAEEVIRSLEPYCSGFLCTYVAATSHEITAAGGITTIDEIRALKAMNIHAAVGMAIYTGRLDLAELSRI